MHESVHNFLSIVNAAKAMYVKLPRDYTVCVNCADIQRQSVLKGNRDNE